MTGFRERPSCGRRGARRMSQWSVLHAKSLTALIDDDRAASATFPGNLFRKESRQSTISVFFVNRRKA